MQVMRVLVRSSALYRLQAVVEAVVMVARLLLVALVAVVAVVKLKFLLLKAQRVKAMLVQQDNLAQARMLVVAVVVQELLQLRLLELPLL
jgi:hypothetical protein